MSLLEEQTTMVSMSIKVIVGVVILSIIISYKWDNHKLVSSNTELVSSNTELVSSKTEMLKNQQHLTKQLKLKDSELSKAKTDLNKYKGLTDQNIEIRSLRKHKLYNQIEVIIIKHNLCNDELIRQRFFAKLLFFTAVVESHGGRHLTQLSGGPGLGYYQIEPSTHEDLYNHYLRYNPIIKKKVISFYDSSSTEKLNLKTNLPYQTVAAYYQYERCINAYCKASSKEFDYSDRSISHLAETYKREWNTSLGKSSTTGATKKYKEFVNSNVFLDN